jgi:hypothetical protein
MLTENDVVQAVRRTLEAEGWQITKLATTRQRGPDIEAIRAGERLVVEAKGETSSLVTSKRFSLPFNSGQVLTHVSRAVFTAMVAQEDGTARAAVAFPRTPDHLAHISRVENTLRQLKIRVLWVRPDGTVSG